MRSHAPAKVEPATTLARRGGVERLPPRSGIDWARAAGVVQREPAGHPAVALPPSVAALTGSAEGARLPSRLQAGIESLSGFDLSGVRVHFGSSKPTQLGAHAFARGTDIHISPGQDHHLPHEAWHVVQQLQGRVAPTAEIEGIAANDDIGLEREADVMGARALSLEQTALGGAAPLAKSAPGAAPVQLQRHIGNQESYVTAADAVAEAQALGLGRINVRLYLDEVNRQDNVNFSFNMNAGGRWAGSTWVSNDIDLGNDRLLHFTLSFDRIHIRHATGAATLDLTNFHATIRTRADSDRIGELAAAHVGDPAGLAAEADYAAAQGRSVHRGPGGAAWNSGNPDNTAAALEHLNLGAATLARFSGDNITRLRAAFGAALEEALVGEAVLNHEVQSLTIRWAV